MECYVGIDLHATNSVVVVSDDADRVLDQKRLRNDLPVILGARAPYRATVQGVVVEATYNWYWLVDGLMEAGYRVHLAHAPALPQDSGLKPVDDQHDAQWFAHLLRLGLLPTGYIDPKAERAVRDLLRKRSQLVRHKTMVGLSLQRLLTRLTGHRLSFPRLRHLTAESVQALVPFPEHVQAVMSSLAVLECLEQEIRTIEGTVREAGRTQPGYALLQTVPGIGPILAGTILLEAGDLRRFATVGHVASYGRCVGSEHVSNGKRNGTGNTKNGNKYLSWAFIEAAHFAIRYEAVIRNYYQRKQARTHPLVALKAVAHKLARACSHMLREQVPFDLSRAFG